MSIILEMGKSPAEWCEVFASKGLPISERNLRSRARELGACHVLGKAMIITPDQIDRILEGTCSSHTGAAQRGGRRGAWNTTDAQLPATSARALEHLTRLERGTGSRKG